MKRRSVVAGTFGFLFPLLALAAGHGGTPLAHAIAGEHRTEANRGRDAARHPAETLAFFGFRPELTVVEILPGGGWYTEILAPAVGGRGRFIAASPGPDAKPEYRSRSHKALLDKFASAQEVYGAAEVVVFDPPNHLELAPPGSVDMVLTFRNTHGWVNSGVAEDVYRSFFAALKPGGVLGVVQHRGVEGADLKDSAKRGYIPEAALVALAESAGFELAARSEVNANPRDTKDYEDGVWTLPPVYIKKDEERDRYAAIGESDRMTLRFVKPR